VSPFFNVVLVEPEIPQNTGNIGRTCVATNSALHLIKPYGFEISDRNLKRAGLDYWPHLTWREYDHWAAYQQTMQEPQRVFYLSAFGERDFFKEEFRLGDSFVFGKETQGLPKDLLRREAKQVLKIPHFGPVRGLNLATAVAVVIYEALRQCQPPPQEDLSCESFKALID
jgi:tRNA (cytidine/uridine-2'-O-)-methyltransferase